jgi:hypothetical protein
MERLDPSPRAARERALWAAWTALLVAAAAAAFWAPAFARTGRWPVPLDDVYIHFGFARSAALGHPFQWIPGNGYSSGGTSLVYPLVLAPGWLLGLRGERLAIFAGFVACASLVDLARSLRALLAAAPRWVAWTAPALLLSIPLLDWSLFSGMETALFAAILGRSLAAVDRASAAPPLDRARAQRSAGLYAALLVATRPEAAPLALLLGVAAAHGARSLPLARSLARSAGPAVAFLAAQAAVNRALTGEWAAAGAVRKLLGSNPYPTPLETAVEVIKNLVALRQQALDSALGGPFLSWTLPLLGLFAAIDRRSRRLAIPLLIGAYASLLLASLNATARFQNLRYAAPTLLMLLAAAVLGVGAIARRRPRALSAAVAAAAAMALIAGPARWFPRQIDHFARASANIADQQVEVARRLAARDPQPRSVLVGDAGAIPYLSGLGAIDGLGLGGYRRMPFARASVHGVPAVVELIERLPDRDRPDVLALYPSWWKGLADVFGRRTDSVKIRDNVICGADEKVIYDADWSSLAPAGETREGAVDEVDVADLIDERAHGYEIPAPHGGWVIGEVLAAADGRARFDGGRIIPQGKSDAFVVRAGIPAGPASLVLRTSPGGELAIRISVERSGRRISSHEHSIPERQAGRWFEIQVPVEEIKGGDRVAIESVRGAFASFHLWVLRR